MEEFDQKDFSLFITYSNITYLLFQIYLQKENDELLQMYSKAYCGKTHNSKIVFIKFSSYFWSIILQYVVYCLKFH